MFGGAELVQMGRDEGGWGCYLVPLPYCGRMNENLRRVREKEVCTEVRPVAPLILPRAPSVFPLKRPCSLSRPGTAISDPKFGVYIIYIYKDEDSM